MENILKSCRVLQVTKMLFCVCLSAIQNPKICKNRDTKVNVHLFFFLILLKCEENNLGYSSDI